MIRAGWSLLGDKLVRQRELDRYWDIVCTDTAQDKAWNTPDYDELMRAVALDNLAATRPPMPLRCQRPACAPTYLRATANETLCRRSIAPIPHPPGAYFY